MDREARNCSLLGRLCPGVGVTPQGYDETTEPVNICAEPVVLGVQLADATGLRALQARVLNARDLTCRLR
jgi:hypothetical protein